MILGREIHPHATGKYNESLFAKAKELLSAKYEVSATDVLEDYDLEVEQGRFLNAQYIIFQFPVYWFNMPPSMKKYIDSVYAYGVLFGHAERYGRGGLLDGKYMISTTWNAPEYTFTEPEEYFSDKTPDEVLCAVHTPQKYIGLERLPSFHALDVVKNPDYQDREAEFGEHLSKVFSL